MKYLSAILITMSLVLSPLVAEAKAKKSGHGKPAAHKTAKAKKAAKKAKGKGRHVAVHKKGKARHVAAKKGKGKKKAPPFKRRKHKNR